MTHFWLDTCWSMNEDGFVCTEPLGHAGDHIARDDEGNVIDTEGTEWGGPEQ